MKGRTNVQATLKIHDRSTDPKIIRKHLSTTIPTIRYTHRQPFGGVECHLFFGGINQCKYMVILTYNKALFGLVSYHDPLFFSLPNFSGKLEIARPKVLQW